MNRIIYQYKKILLAAVLVLVVSLTVVIVVAAQVRDGVDLSWYVVSSGAARSQHEAPDYVLYSTVGQTAVGESIHSPNYVLSHGFWQTFIDTLRNMLPFAVKN